MSEQYVLVDSFRGRLSDFADEDVYSMFRSRQLRRTEDRTRTLRDGEV